MKAKVTIVKLNREKVVLNAHVTRDEGDARDIVDAAIATHNIPRKDIKVAEYTIDGQHVFAYLRQAGGLHILTPSKKDSAPAVVENFDHDDCPACGTASVPAEGVSDQSLRTCPKCGNDWFEDLNSPPQKGALNR